MPFTILLVGALASLAIRIYFEITNYDDFILIDLLFECIWLKRVILLFKFIHKIQVKNIKKLLLIAFLFRNMFDKTQLF